MWHDGYDGKMLRIGFARSNDGKVWDNFPTPVLDGSSINQDYAEPFVMFDEGKYKMWFLSVDRNTGNTSIKYSESEDGIKWDTPVISLEPTEAWEIQHLAHPHVIKVGSIYKLYYNGLSGSTWSIGNATSVDGIKWQKNSNNPILSPDISESPTLGGPYVTYNNSKYHLYYHSKNPSKNIKVAESPDGINWSNKEILINTSPAGFDNVAIISPSLVRNSNEIRLYYAGFNGSRWAIGYASLAVDTPVVPLLKQTSNPWQDDVYDRANLWASHNSSINRWGCAITSAAMVLQYHGYSKLPNGEALDPGTLNIWLKSQSDGYVGNGLVNWIALTRLSKLAGNINNITDYEALEFSRTGRNQSLLEDDLANNHPVILSQPGHFIVATHKLTDTIAINDPYHDRSTLKEGYNNNYLALYRFIPSNTDLSYMMLSLPTNIDAEIIDKNGKVVSESYIEPAIIAPDDQTITSGNDTKIVLIEKPQTDSYTLRIKSNNPQTYSLKLFLYDINGNQVEHIITGMADKKYDSFRLMYDKENNGSSVVNKEVSYESILNDMTNAYQKKLMRIDAYKAIESVLKSAQKNSKKNKHFPEKIKLQTALQLTTRPFDKSIDNFFKSILQQDLKTLLSS